ncbi:phosphotransferase family protein [Streptomyces sp. NPDC059785]|uniref:phosphotransferase family protein n=1 Tax=Streptomyces sp. NPDC059785 TaxID=3346945 RepID=UPI00365A89D5
MKSTIKRSLTPADVEQRIREATGIDWRVECELTDGWFNSAYRVTADHGMSAVVKLGPAPDAPVLKYERGIMGTEADFYRRVTAHRKVPIPELLHAESDFLLISVLPGEPWNKAAARLPREAREKLLRRVGEIVADLHAIREGAGLFGCPAPEAGLLADDWPTAFTAMVEAILEDAERWRSPLGVSTDEVRARVEAGADALEEVRQPSLVHFDLWPGNIFVDGVSVPGDPPRVSGIIDHERAFWGDPVAELVSLEICGDVGPGSDFLAGYLDGGGELEYTPAALRRLALYRLYFSLILVVECGPRGYRGDYVARCSARLDAAVDALRALDGH